MKIWKVVPLPFQMAVSLDHFSVLQSSIHHNLQFLECMVLSKDLSLSMEKLRSVIFTQNLGGHWEFKATVRWLKPLKMTDFFQIRPMMYVALTYDHRLIDGREAVTFLKGIKQKVEDPRRLLLDL